MSSEVQMPLSVADLEEVLGWVDTFKLSRPMKKINRDFSDAVMLAEILSLHYPKLVEMHNYPPRNSHALKLNNWLTLNKKVLRKLKLTLCSKTMQQLANCEPGVIERVLVAVREQIRRDQTDNKINKNSKQTLSSGGSYYEACGEDECVLLVPVKTRVNGVLETIQQKLISYDIFLTAKEELKDMKESSEVLKRKVEHLQDQLKLKDERITELQSQLERKQARRKEVEALQSNLAIPQYNQVILQNNQANIQNSQAIPLNNSLGVPFDVITPPSLLKYENAPTNQTTAIEVKKTYSGKSIELKPVKSEESKIPIKTDSKPKLIEPPRVTEVEPDLDRVKSDVFKEVEIVDEPAQEVHDEFKDSVDAITTIRDTIKQEMNDISVSLSCVADLN